MCVPFNIVQYNVLSFKNSASVKAVMRQFHDRFVHIMFAQEHRLLSPCAPITSQHFAYVGSLAGPVITDQSDNQYVGACQLSSATGELSAQIWGLIHAHGLALKPQHVCPSPDITFHYDSSSAGGMNFHSLCPSSNYQLVNVSSSLFLALSQIAHVHGAWIQGHSGHPLD